MKKNNTTITLEILTGSDLENLFLRAANGLTLPAAKNPNEAGELPKIDALFNHFHDLLSAKGTIVKRKNLKDGCRVLEIHRGPFGDDFSGDEIEYTLDAPNPRWYRETESKSAVVTKVSVHRFGALVDTKSVKSFG